MGTEAPIPFQCFACCVCQGNGRSCILPHGLTASGSVGSGSPPTLTGKSVVSSGAAGKIDDAFLAALSGVGDGVPDMAQQRRLRELAAHMGIAHAKMPTFAALSAVLDQVAFPSRFPHDKGYWERHKASRSNFQSFKAKLLPVAHRYRAANADALHCGNAAPVAPAAESSTTVHRCLQCRVLLPQELFGLGRCPSCVDYDGPGRFASARKCPAPLPHSQRPEGVTKPSRFHQATHSLRSEMAPEPPVASTLPARVEGRSRNLYAQTHPG